MKKTISTKLYMVTLILTLLVFSAALYASSYINKKRTDGLKADEDKITVDILSLETELDALKNTNSCSSLTTTTLRNEMDDLNSRLNFMEQQVGENDPEVYRLKRYYSLLEIRDYLLTKQAGEECKRNDILVIYFYSSKNCSQCTDESYVLQALQVNYPQVKVYSFDYNLDLAAVKSQIRLNSIPTTTPVLYVNGKLYNNFSTLSDIEETLRPILTATSTTATTSALQKKSK